eukprot:CAMPEP_0117571424 /NCGR_PEP_ID=MMETSP0784-20121206/59744_1 /TAXON_ID=39447 /ORGANISM="" /LENGTH=163 /DNA_ID=CAMNT_0005369583 /DNA_START=21 /DNA_END=512 /DNA_ORIENTATION=-
MSAEAGDGQEEQNPNSIPLTQASLQQLNMVKQQLEKELGSLANNLEALREAEGRFKSSMNDLNYLTPENEGQAMMVPLTSSLYVDGKMNNTSTVVVDVGTGYFIEMSVARAKEFCARRIKMLSDNAGKVEKVMKEKRKHLETVTITMQQKLYKMQQEQGAGQQ